MNVIWLVQTTFRVWFSQIPFFSNWTSGNMDIFRIWKMILSNKMTLHVISGTLWMINQSKMSECKDTFHLQRRIYQTYRCEICEICYSIQNYTLPSIVSLNSNKLSKAETDWHPGWLSNGTTVNQWMGWEQLILVLFKWEKTLNWNFS